MEDFGVKPKMIDYGDDAINTKCREIEKENKMCNNISDNDKKKKTKE